MINDQNRKLVLQIIELQAQGNEADALRLAVNAPDSLQQCTIDCAELKRQRIQEKVKGKSHKI